jgi:hypothetical protein
MNPSILRAKGTAVGERVLMSATGTVTRFRDRASSAPAGMMGVMTGGRT